MTLQKTKKRYLDLLETAFGADIGQLMQNTDVIEIMLNPDGKLWAESYERGKYFTGVVFSPEQGENIIKLVASNRQEIANRENPEIACELPETGARFQGWLPPVVSHPAFCIRKKAVHIFSLEDYIAQNSLSKKHAEILKKAVLNRKNILISGGTATGKTTFANAILNELRGSNDRIIILEDLPELQIVVDDFVKLRTSDTKNMRDLVKGVLRMRPDRIIIGEVRDGAALDLLKAWNTGHPGGICTIHANSPEATLMRLEDLIQEAIPIVPKRLIQEAIDLIVFMKRGTKGQYLVDSIHEYKKIDNLFTLKKL
ncbi:MAG: P-type conjugative transfer ATPase TrbB [Gammaproteobacteria bacterium]|nr:P-type conjugative transfer ATPase TrbB [Gammaproteobacteria bacterium]